MPSLPQEVVKTMRRRGRKGKGRRGKRGAFPLLAALPVAVPLYNAYKAKGLTAAFPENYIWQQTGWSIESNRLDTYKTKDVLFLALGGFVGHKIANKIGVNKYMRKLTLGYLQL